MSRQQKILKVLWFVALVLLAILLFTSALRFGQRSELKGAIAVAKKPMLNAESWMSGRLRGGFEQLAVQNFGFYEQLVKLHNQWDFSLWKKINAHKVVLGKENYLFEQNYIDDLYGKNYLKESKQLRLKKKQIIAVHQQLKDRNKQLLFISMPSKAVLYDSKIAEKERQVVPKQNIQDDFTEFTEEAELNLIDFQKYFLEIQDTLKYPVFSKQGIHLSEYAESIVLDSLLKYINKQLDLEPYVYHFGETEETTVPRGRDNDIANAMNLWKPLTNDETLAYRKFKLDKKPQVEPKILVIGDSFYCKIQRVVERTELFGQHEFWYRNHRIYKKHNNKLRYSNRITVVESLDKFEFIIILVRSNSLDQVGWGYFESLSKHQGTIDLTPQAMKQINKTITSMHNNPQMKNYLKQKAKDQNISLDSMMYLDAVWLYRQGR